METSTYRIFKYKLAGWMVLAFNVISLIVVVLLDRELAMIAVNYSFFTLMYITALTCTAFALHDNSAVMLYPILVSLISFIAIPSSLCFVCALNSIYCSILLKKDIHISFLDCDDDMKLPLVHNVILFAIIVEKTLEFVFFRRLMKILEQQHYAEHFQNTNVKGTINTNCDTDDEVVVFEKISQSSGQSTIYDYGTKQTPTSVA